MKQTLIKAAAAATFAAALALAPVAAHAEVYPPADSANVSSTTVTPGGTVTFSVDPGVFTPGEPVTITLEGESASGASLAFVKFAVESATLGTVEATADGGVAPVDIVFPSNASGVYTISAFSETSPGVSVSVSVPASGAGAGGGLPATGLDSNALLGLWVGGGALVLAGGALAVATTVRRNRQHAEV
ncbi:LPXTG cell wall anchor domain-containing protein [Microbacterium sp. Marseille-Q6648]|jgi:LPXTG-motif cell wall-anchored protein|uniref:LPXTG cell wall anchor domain-containing protein n=1 Tax=Microbacterium sp. Marseille-Q6648 TaxID=2937991 RepID=UPI002041B3BF|nr:LPXTG cell wall anchor domain-containing protein [Microbacterium sp. Marseille-Q6648]